MLSWGTMHPLELISARIDGEVTPGEVRYLEAHLRSCPSCEQKEAELKTIISELAGLEVAPLPAGTIDRLLVRLASNEPAPQAAPSVAVAAAAVEAETEAETETEAEQPSPALATARRFPWKTLVSAGAAAAVVVILYTIVGGVRGDRVGATAVSMPSAVPASPAPQNVPEAEAAILVEPAPAALTVEERPRPAPAPRRQILTWKEAPVAQTPRVAATPEPQDVEPLPEATQPTVDEPRNDASVDTAAALDPINFRGSSKRLTREAKQRVAAAAELLRQHPEAALLIQGYADGRGSIEKNRALGQRRAQAVARQIEKLGIDAKRLRPVSLGGEHPEAADDDRVEFVLTR